MRSLRLTSLVILGLLASGPWVHADGRWFKKVVRPVLSPAAAPRSTNPQPREAEPSAPWTVDGWGETPAIAEQMALEHARREIVHYFAQQNHPLVWQPTLPYIDKNLIKKREPLPSEDFKAPLGHTEGVRLWIEIGPDKWQAILQENRRLLADARILLSSRLLVGVVAFLGAIAGYLRLEEMTKGYYTAWLRLAAVGFVSAVGAAIWWLS